MPKKSQKTVDCQVCSANTSKYTCSKCYIPYCSVACYKQHQRIPPFKGVLQHCDLNSSLSVDSCVPASGDPNTEADAKTSRHITPQRSEEPLEEKPSVLRPLTSLKWPYAPEESAYPDPLKRDDPKDLQLHQYEAIATSPKIREILAKHDNLPALLSSIDKLRGAEREHALQKALGVTAPDIDHGRKHNELSEDVLALRELAEAVESAVRGGNESALGLNWGSE